ncbi:hypothetical protein JNK13_03675 [bacterium]|nr:hypothetical protein [bacterium]
MFKYFLSILLVASCFLTPGLVLAEQHLQKCTCEQCDSCKDKAKNVDCECKDCATMAEACARSKGQASATRTSSADGSRTSSGDTKAPVETPTPGSTSNAVKTTAGDGASR